MVGVVTSTRSLTTEYEPPCTGDDWFSWQVPLHMSQNLVPLGHAEIVHAADEYAFAPEGVKD